MTFAQVAWVVDDLARAEASWAERGVAFSFRMEAVKAADIAATYRGQPADFEIDVLIGYQGDLQIELIRPISGTSIYTEFLDGGGTGVHHIAYAVDDAAGAADFLAARGAPVVQTVEIPMMKAIYCDTSDSIGVMTEVVELTDDARAFFDALRSG